MTNMEILEKAEKGKYSPCAASAFIRDMEPFLRSVSSRFSSQERFRPFCDDIFVSAEVGMYKAIRNFDFSKRGFIRYARKSVEMEIRLFLSNETRIVRLPRYVIAAQKIMSDYRRQNGGEDRRGEMAAAGITSEKTYDLIENARSFSCVASLDRTVNDKGTTLSSFIPGEEGADEELMRNETEREIFLSLQSLAPVERYIIVHSFGLGGEEKKKNSEMASALGISCATVISRRRRALAILRANLLPLVT